ncbi:MAG TPA: PAS domain-containing protein [Vicinamibacterales bacterium]|nr:PAS domain-containing protein [Vicinamibacterales bacterium]
MGEADPGLADTRGSEWQVHAALLEALVRHAPVGIAFVDLDCRFLLINDTLAEINGLAASAHIGKTVEDVVPDLWPTLQPILARVRDNGEPVTNVEVKGQVPSSPGVQRHWLEGFYPVRDGTGVIAGIGMMAVELTQQKRAEANQRAMLAAMPDFIFDLAADGTHLSFHAPQEEALFVKPDQIIGRRVRELLPGEVAARYEFFIRRALESRQMQVFEYQLTYPDQGDKTFDARMVRKGPGEVLVMVRDITEQRQSERARQLLEEQFRQAQKMEAVGQLAGGIAHDFNNLLTVIHGSSEMVLNELPLEHPAREYLVDIQRAGERAGTLTRQLLLFSRQQVLEPRVLSLNAVISDAEKMLRRLIGEDIQFRTMLSPDLGAVMADAGQIEQALLNLCVNARDAMPVGGHLTVSTRNIELDEHYARTHDNVRPGPYCLMSVSDTGSGMDDATRARIFEPFFTTKSPGKGTGLGLAVVLGVMKQSGGHVEVYTEAGHGTVFKLYFPQVSQPAAATGVLPPSYLLPTGTETVLLAEDDEDVRTLAREILEQCGYTVLEAADGRQAMEVFDRHDGPLDMLISDVVMPHVSGRQLAEAIMRTRPNLKVLFLSGYTDDAVVRHGVLQAEFAFMQKPFTLSGLAIKVRQVLDQPAAP